MFCLNPFNQVYSFSTLCGESHSNINSQGLNPFNQVYSFSTLTAAKKTTSVNNSRLNPFNQVYSFSTKAWPCYCYCLEFLVSIPLIRSIRFLHKFNEGLILFKDNSLNPFNQVYSFSTKTLKQVAELKAEKSLNPFNQVYSFSTEKNISYFKPSAE